VVLLVNFFPNSVKMQSSTPRWGKNKFREEVYAVSVSATHGCITGNAFMRDRTVISISIHQRTLR